MTLDHRSHVASRSEKISSVPLTGIFINAILAAVKVTAGVLGNSYALIADGIESTSDIATSFVVWGGLRVAARPANETHPYGFGKAEALAGVATATALLAAAAMIAFQSVREILTPHHLPHWSTLAVLALVIITKEALARWVGGVGEQFESSALKGDAWHHRADAITSLAAFIGISIALVGGPGYEPADDWAALLACVVIAWSGIGVMRLAVGDVLDIAPPRKYEDQVRQLASVIPGVLAIEKCRIRKSGMYYFVEIHVEVDGKTSVDAAHVIGGQVRSTLRESSLNIADAIIHIEPHPESTTIPPHQS